MRAVLFDMDGVIFDSERAQKACWLQLAERMGLADMEQVYDRCLGVTFAATEQILKEAYGPDFPWRAFREEGLSLYLERYGGGRLPLKRGARELLEELRERQIPTALASSTGTELVMTWLDGAGLRPFFDAVVTGDMVSHSKPDPEIFLLAARLLGARPEESFVIEDSFNGVRAGACGGFHTIMVPDLLPPDDTMRALAEHICADLFEVNEIIAAGFRKQ